jgi:hypothetical protein
MSMITDAALLNGTIEIAGSDPLRCENVVRDGLRAGARLGPRSPKRTPTSHTMNAVAGSNQAPGHAGAETQGGTQTPATFTPYLQGRQERTVSDSVAYIRVRVPDGPRPDGSIVAYLPDGTALIVGGHELLHLDTTHGIPPRATTD